MQINNPVAVSVLFTVEDVIETHDDILLVYKGRPGLDRGALESALAAPDNTLAYLPESDVFDIAACLMYHLIKDHAFDDGNKRTGLVTTMMYLALHSIGIDCTQSQIVKLAERVAKGNVPKERLPEFFRKRAHFRSLAETRKSGFFPIPINSVHGDTIRPRY